MNMPRAKEIRDLKIDEVSLVDKGANQHAKTVIAKRHEVEEETTVEKYYNQAGDLIDLDELKDGEHVWNEAGEEFVFTDEDSDDEVEVEEREPELVGKSSVFAKSAATVESSFVDSVREELSKALTDKDRDDVIAKALGQVSELEKIAKRAEQAAAAERDLRLTREYTEIAKAYNVPVSPEELGPVLKRLGEVLTVSEQMVIKKCLDATAASEDLFREYGSRGGADNDDVFTKVEQIVDGYVSKGDSSREEAVTKAFEDNPDAYDEYLAAQRGL